MKILYTLLFCISLAIPSFAGQVLNPGFENWTNGEPDNWFTNNDPGYVPVTMVTPGHSGSFAIQGSVIDLRGFNLSPLLISGTNGNGFAVTMDFTRLTFYVKTNLTAGDYFSAYIVMTDMNGDAIGSGEDTSSSAYPGFTMISVPISYASAGAVNCTIEFTIENNLTGAGTLGSSFILDDVDLTFATGTDQPNISDALVVYPVPASDQLQIRFKNIPPDNSELQIMNNQGQLVALKNIDPSGIFSVSELPCGFYDLVYRNGNAILSKRFVIER